MTTTKQFGEDFASAGALTGTETVSVNRSGTGLVDTTLQDIADLSGGGGGVVPTGTGFTHITAGVQDAAAKLVDTADINADQVTNTKLADMATATIKGRTTAGTGDPEDLTAAQTSTLLQGDGLDTDAAGFRGIPQNSQSGNYTCVAADAGKEIFHPSGAGAGDTFTIPANASVAYEIGTAITFTNMDSNALSIAITTDTMNLAGTGTTGTRTLAQYGTATARKITSTGWLISGVGLT